MNKRVARFRAIEDEQRESDQQKGSVWSVLIGWRQSDKRYDVRQGEIMHCCWKLAVKESRREAEAVQGRPLRIFMIDVCLLSFLRPGCAALATNKLQSALAPLTIGIGKGPCVPYYHLLTTYQRNSFEEGRGCWEVGAEHSSRPFLLPLHSMCVWREKCPYWLVNFSLRFFRNLRNSICVMPDPNEGCGDVSLGELTSFQCDSGSIPDRYHSWILAYGNRAGLSHCLASFLWDLPIPRSSIPALPHTLPHSPSSALSHSNLSAAITTCSSGPLAVTQETDDHYTLTELKPLTPHQCNQVYNENDCYNRERNNTEIYKERIVIQTGGTNENSSKRLVGISPGFSHIGIVLGDAVGRWVFPGHFSFSRPYILALLHTHPIGSKRC
ncbi:hypothetical protein PR048_005326 [Dryococelus australis]|uniref:Uncharacterized protein n=1 Tax=Dryococelus australis TaxID=614101 RepID=A0ABQ9I7X8_9NEOP|nr:hypothetical protein PR048_005326 [Dryococelus australis]